MSGEVACFSVVCGTLVGVSVFSADYELNQLTSMVVSV